MRPEPRDAAAPGLATRGERESELRAGTSPSVEPPTDYAVEAEQTVIGAFLLAAPGLQASALGELRDDDFTDLRCRFALTVARRMLADGVPVDQVTMHSYVERHALLSDCRLRGSLALWLADRTTGVPVPGNLLWYVLAVIEAASRRQIAETGRRISTVAAVGSVADVSTIVDTEMTAATVALARLKAVTTNV